MQYMPPRENSWLVLNDWRHVLRKAKTTLNCQITLLYIALNSDEKSLPQKAHQAKPDTLMMLKLVELYFEYVDCLKKREQRKLPELFQEYSSQGNDPSALSKIAEIEAFNDEDSEGYTEPGTEDDADLAL